MNPKIKQLNSKKLVGIKLTMSLSNNKTRELWQQFMPRRTEVLNKSGNEFISMQVYQPNHFLNFHPDKEFDKWATIEVTNFGEIPFGMESYSIPEGLYAVFQYQGSSTDNRIFQTIFNVWLPESEFVLDDRPHFEILGEKYKNNDPESEEEIWIHIKKI